MQIFEPIDQRLFFSKQDVEDPRLGDLVSPVTIQQVEQGVDDLAKHSWLFAGYPDDEGIGLNGGRLGARLGPEQVRQAFYKQTPPTKQLIKLFDLGDLSTACDLAKRHELGRPVGFLAQTAGDQSQGQAGQNQKKRGISLGPHGFPFGRVRGSGAK